MENSLEILIYNCLLSKLARERYEDEDHPEYQTRNIRLKENFPKLISLIESRTHKDQQKDSRLLAYVLIVYLELKSEGPWNIKDSHHQQYSEELDRCFKNRHNIELIEVLYSERYNSQEIFDTCIKELHKKMTMGEFKKYPSLIEVYCLLVKNVKKHNVVLNPVTVLPVALLLIEDYVPANKIKGLQSCTVILQNLTTEVFTSGNYYEVVYSSLKKNIVEKDKKVTQALFECYIAFLDLLPTNIKKIKLDDIFSSNLDQLHMETNLYRKADFFDFTTKIIEMHGIHCVKKKIFKDIICDSIDSCGNESVADILLLNVLECLQTWIRYCWCIWRLSADQKMLSSLFKMLYLAKDDTIKTKIQNLIITLIKLCSKEEQMDILENLDEPLPIKNEQFISRLEEIKNVINN